ncbi:MAG: hypothetical protein AAGK09_04495 [Planctomycetota bacterium]
MSTHLASIAMAGGAAALAWVATPAVAWHDEAHVYSSIAAVETLPDEVPAFFRDAAHDIAQGSIDPDAFKHPQTPQLNRAEGPEHYFDLEYLEGHALPPDRYAYLALLRELEVDPHSVGTLPYAIAEWAQRLTLAFAEVRADPDDAHARMKAIVYAGVLAHYAGDLTMPLHVSIHWDGRANPDGSSPRTGIHQKIDALPTHLPFDAFFAEPLPPLAKIAPDSDGLFGFIIESIDESRSHVDLAYKLEDRMPDPRPLGIEDEEVIAFTVDRTRQAAWVIASLFMQCWEASAEIEPHWWLDRPAFREGFDRSIVPAQPTPPAGQ